MGSASFSSEMVKITGFVSLLCFSFGLYGSKGCLQEERTAALQLWDFFNSHGSTVHTKLEGDDCCQWVFLECDLFNSTNRVVIIDLSYQSYTTGLGTLYPNASLFTHFSELQKLYLDGNNIGGWIMPEALCELRNLKVLSLSGNSLDDGGLPRCLARDLPFLREIYLQSNSLNLSSPLLSAICGLRNLRVLDLSNNVLSNGSFPPCMLGTFSSLEELYLGNFTLEQSSSNVLTALQGARNLQYLDLSNNNLSDGSMRALCEARNVGILNLEFTNFNMEHIPHCQQQNHSSLEKLILSNTFATKDSDALLEGLICRWKKFKRLDLSMNDLNDERLPSCLLHNNPVLEGLDLSSNNLKGSLGFSTGLCKLRKLRYLNLGSNSIDNINWTCLSSQLNSLQSLDLSSNKLEGVVFFSMFANLSKLEEINLSNNRELKVETESPTWVPSFQLNSLLLENCKIRNIPHFISNQYNLSILSLSYNSLQGTIPSWLLYNVTSLSELYLRGNHFHGPFPLPMKNRTSTLQLLDISDSNIEGQLPGNIDVIFPKLFFFNMSTNKLEGCIPPSLPNIIDLEVLDLSNNYFVGEIPRRLTQNNTFLYLLSLSNNNLHAIGSVSNMTYLHFLSLDGNRFTTLFPVTPSSLPFLELLDVSRNSISGYIQDWLPAFPQLVALLMRGNHLVGYIPTSLCQMKQLRFLDLSNNHLSGSIPSCLDNITSMLEKSELPFGTDIILDDYMEVKLKVNFATKGNMYSYEGLPLAQMTGIDFSLNQLSGHIPSQMGKLIALHSLNLSHNSLMGYFLESFQGLEKLESLDLSHNKLVGMIPPQIVQLYFLEIFSVAFNQLSGKIPYEKNFASFTQDSYIALCELRNLEELDLGGNSLDDRGLPRCLARGLPFLGGIFIDGNSLNLSSHFLSALCGLKNLRTLDLSSNVLSNGSFPHCMLGTFSSLEELHLRNFSLEQPSSNVLIALQGARNLHDLDLSNNNLSDGSLKALCEARNLWALDLSYSNLNVEHIPHCLQQNHSSLEELILQGTFTTKDSDALLKGLICKWKKLKSLDLSMNDLSDERLPFCLLHNNSVLDDLDLSSNNLKGSLGFLTGLCKLRKLWYLNLRNNSIDNINWTCLSSQLNSLQSLDLSHNQIPGTIPPFVSNLTSLVYLDLSSNKLEGVVFFSMFANLSKLAEINLSNNKDLEIETESPTWVPSFQLDSLGLENSSVFNMTDLRLLRLDGNRFTTLFPIIPSTLPSLELLDISRNSISSYIQDWLPAFPQMVALLMRGNDFVGCLPTSLCQMQQLRFLDLSNNRLSGSIPSCLNNITSLLEKSELPLRTTISGSNYMEVKVKVNFATKRNLYSYEGLPLAQMAGIDLSLNQFSGDVPSQMGELRALRSLNLSHNSLMGYFPISFQALELLESLDLSHNKLVGMIPPQMIRLSFLSTFNVAFNQLSGKIPYENNFATFTKDSYIGNPGLCGPPTEVNCSSPQPPHDEYKEGDVDEQSLIDNDLFFYSYVAISYILGFWIVVAPLLLSRNWRRKYYKVVDGCIEWCSDRLFWFLFYIKNYW
ncbi:receptor like protein 21-like [Macadamia integrifolia]|uniref:receptor like protein 21-like n=1 Tax=Macadamia integrifolia TaxID=60698 RepID=UPI001C4F7BBB|nr:receptor like protein 21-like [Macadamia integrifolia]